MTRHCSRISIGFGCLLAALPLAAAPTATDAARTALQALYNKRDTAISHKDAAALWSVRTNDFVTIDQAGHRLDAAQIKTKEARLFAMAKSLQGTSSIEEVRLRGDTASVVVNESGTVVLTNPATKQESVLKLNGQYEDSWVKQNEGWRMAQSETLRATTTLDGQPVQP